MIRLSKGHCSQFLFSMLLMLTSSCGKIEPRSESSNNTPIILSELSISKSPEVNPEELQDPAEDYLPGKILVSSQFNQDYPFNMYLPKIDNQSPSIGCTNAALLGLLHYYRKAISPSGTHYQSHPNKTYELLSFDSLSAMAKLPNQINSFSPWWEQDLMAQLALYLTEINDTELSLNQSSSRINWERLRRYFGISKLSSASFTTDYLSSNIINQLIQEIDAKRPVLLHMTGGPNISVSSTDINLMSLETFWPISTLAGMEDRMVGMIYEDRFLKQWSILMVSKSKNLPPNLLLILSLCAQRKVVSRLNLLTITKDI